MAIVKNDIVIRDENYIPSGLNNNSSHYIDTGIQLDNNSRVEIEFKLNSLPASVMSAYIFGVKGTISGSSVSTALYTNRRNEESTDCVFRASIPGSTANIIGTAELNHIYKVVFDYAEKKVTLDGIVSTLSSSLTAWEFPGNAYVFSSNDALAAIKASITLYSMRIYKGGNLVRNYTPKQGESSSGLYDAISETLNTGSGSGSFTFVPASGELFRFSTNRIDNMEIQTAVNIVGEELSIDTLSTTVIDNAKEGTVLVPDDTSDTVLMYNGFLTSDGFILATDIVDAISAIVNIKYGTPIYWEVNNELQGKFYAKKVTRIGKNRYKMDAISAIGLLDKIPHQGGVYFRERFDRLLKEIMAKGVSYRRIPLNYEEYLYIEKTSSLSTIQMDDISNALEVVVDVQIPTTLSAGVTYTLFGATSGSNRYILSVTGSQSDNQRAYGTNLKAEMGVSAYWAGDNQLPYMQPGSQHRIGFKGYVAMSPSNTPYYHLDLFCDGVLYEGSVPSTTVFNTTTGVSLLAENNGGAIRNVATGALIRRYEAWKSGKKIRDVVFAEPSNLPGYAVPFDMISNNTTGIVVNGFTLGPKIPVGDQTPVVPYTIEQASLASMLVSGYLPSASKRKNLYQLLFATNANLVKNADGSLIFKWLDNNNPEPIIDSDIYLEGEVEYPAEVSEVAVTEHTYVGSDGNIQTLFETEEAVSEKQVYFSNAPIYIPSIEAGEGLTLLYATVNYAIVSGAGKLTGCKYLHNATVNSATNPDAFEGKVVEVKDATLVSPLTSVNVRDRLMQFYKNGIKVRNSIVLDGQTAGKPYTFNNPFKDFVTGILEKLEINVSAKTKADAEFCVGYQPNGGGGIYAHTIVKTASGSFTFPEGVTSAKVILVGAGDGGYSGTAGESSEPGNKYDRLGFERGGKGGKGGIGGQPGNNGKVFSFDLSDRLSHTFTITIGTGGTGGSRSSTATSNAGGTGGATTFKDNSDNTTWSSDSGARGVYVNPISGEKYSLPGEPGVNGGDGGSSYGFTQNPAPGNTATMGTGVIGPDNTQYLGGYAGTPHYMTNGGTGATDGVGGGGCGGGAAVGANGNRGGDGSIEWVAPEFDAYGGRGAAGANATDRTETASYGQGGHGGHGGGGAGAGGDAWMNPSSSNCFAFQGYGNGGGTGGAGGHGGNGCVIILY